MKIIIQIKKDHHHHTVQQLVAGNQQIGVHLIHLSSLATDLKFFLRLTFLLCFKMTFVFFSHPFEIFPTYITLPPFLHSFVEVVHSHFLSEFTLKSMSIRVWSKSIGLYIYIQTTFLPSFQIVSDITFTLFLSLSDFFVLDPLAFSVVALCTLKYKCISIQL